MAKQDEYETIIPEKQTKASLEGLAGFFDSAAQQLRFAASQLEDGAEVDVTGTSTLRVGFKHVRNWIGNLSQAIATRSMHVAFGAVASKIDEEIREIKSNHARETKELHEKLKSSGVENFKKHRRKSN